jgi:dihydroflavonol-4-reductase
VGGIALPPDPAYWSGRTVCVTGGTGFLGFHLVRLLGELGARVRVFALDPRADHPIRSLPNAQLMPGDVLDPVVVRRALAGCSVVMHAAGIVAVWGPALKKMWPVHVDGTRNVLDALEPGARLVHTSSVVAVGASRTRTVLNEDSPFHLQQLKLDYVQAKRAAEALALGSSKDVVVVNPGYLIGPEDYDRSVMGQFCRRFWRGAAPIAPPGGLNLVDVRDVAAGHLLAAELGQRGRRYILGGEDHDYRSFVRQLCEVAGLRPRWIPYVPRPLFTLGAAVNQLRSWLRGRKPYPSLAHARLNRYFWFYSSDRARHELGYDPRPVRQSLADAYAWWNAGEPFQYRGLNRFMLRPSTSGPTSAAA